MAALAFEGVTKVFPDGTEAVSDFDLDVGDGELMVLVGPSGSGKSTALRMLAGLEEATAGTIRIGTRVVNDVAPKDRDIAMVFQSYALYPHMDVAHNLGFALRMQRMQRASIAERVSAAAQRLGPLRAGRASARGTSRAASASAWPWGARSCASRRPSSWTSRCRTSTRSCAWRCAPTSRGCARSSAPRRSTSPTTRSRR